jgi:hypothetical protein
MCFVEQLTAYAGSGFSPPNLIAELETGDEGKLWSCVWEATLYRHLCLIGYKLRNPVRKKGQNGPDFCIEREGRTIWIEATVPSPEGIPAEYLALPRKGEYLWKKKPDEPRVLRCTSAISETEEIRRISG